MAAYKFQIRESYDIWQHLNGKVNSNINDLPCVVEWFDVDPLCSS